MNDFMKMALSVAAAALVGLLVWFGVINRGDNDADLNAYGIERGTFTMLQNGQAIGQDEFVLSTTEIQINLNSTVVLGNGDSFTPQFRLSNTWQPVRYFRNSNNPVNRNTVLVEVSAEQIRMNRFADGQARESTLQNEPPLILLDEDVPSHFVVLQRLFYSQPQSTLTALLPSSLESTTLTLEFASPAALISGPDLVSAQRQIIRLGEQTVYLYSQDGVLIAVSHPNQSRFSFRSDLFPKGLQER